MDIRQTVDAAQIQELDRKAIEDYGVPSLALMENAGRAVALAALQQWPATGRRRIGIVCGHGNNAGDGLVAARHLWNTGVEVTLMLLGDPQQLKHDAAVNFKILERCAYPFTVIESFTQAHQNQLADLDGVIDAIFGVGLNREVQGVYRQAIESLQVLAQPVLAVDVPSGLDATTGQVWGTAVKAAITVTFTLAKTGMFKAAGPEHCGRVQVVDIGIPRKLLLE